MSALQDKYVNPLTDFGFKKLFEAAEIAQFSPEERDAYEESLKYYRDMKNVIDTSMTEGLKKGIKEGRKEGHKEGRKEGRKERSLEIARELKKNNVPVDVIIKTTGLTREEIEGL